MNYLLLSLIITCALYSMDPEILNMRVQLASPQELNRRFNNAEWGQFLKWKGFNKKTHLGVTLGGQTKNPSEVMDAIGQAMTRCLKYINTNPTRIDILEFQDELLLLTFAGHAKIDGELQRVYIQRMKKEFDVLLSKSKK